MLPSSHSIVSTLYCENEEKLNTEGRTYIVSLYILCGVVVSLDDCYTDNDEDSGSLCINVGAL